MPVQSILFISSMKGDPWGGSEEFWFRMALWMAARGYYVHCAFYAWPYGRHEKIILLERAGIKITQLANSRLAKNIFDKLNKKRIAQRELLQLLVHRYDLVIISQGGSEEILYPPFRKILPLLNKFVLVYHNYNEKRLLSLRRKQRLQDWTTAAALNMADAGKIFTVLKNAAGFDITNKMVFVNPLTIALHNKPVDWPLLNENGNYCWVVMAQLDIKRKAQDILIKALSDKKWEQRNWELYLYGSGEDKDLLTHLIATSPIKDKIHLMGHTNNVEKVLQQAHLLLQITHIDAMPLSVTEAMSMARPCVVSPVGDMPLWIKDGINGYVTPDVTKAVINEVLEKAWAQRNNWQQIGIEAFNTFRQKYPKPYEEFYEKIFEDLINDKK